MPQISTLVSLNCNGNNLQISIDLASRVLRCTIDARVERPGTREFSWDPVEYARDNRVELVAAALTILLAYQNAADRVKGLKPMGGLRRGHGE